MLFEDICAVTSVHVFNVPPQDLYGHVTYIWSNIFQDILF